MRLNDRDELEKRNLVLAKETVDSRGMVTVVTVHADQRVERNLVFLEQFHGTQDRPVGTLSLSVDPKPIVKIGRANGCDFSATCVSGFGSGLATGLGLGLATGFGAGLTATVGSGACASIVIVGPTEARCTTPPGPAGPANVVATSRAYLTGSQRTWR